MNRLLLLMSLGVLAAAAWSPAADPAPATRPLAPGPAATQPAQPQPTPAQVGGWVNGLDDDDPQVRQHALAGLMGLRHADLPMLKQVLQARGLSAGQKQAIHGVVQHLYLMSDDTDPAARPFLGLHWEDASMGEDYQPEGVIVEDRFPGFASWAALQTGDILKDFHSPQEVSDYIAGCHPGQKITLNVVRNGQTIQVPLVLGARPAALPPEGATSQDLAQWQSDRLDEAAKYWNTEFAPAVGETPAETQPAMGE